MGIPSELEPLVVRDRLHELRFGQLPVFAHDDHRFLLLLVHWAQSQGLLPRPTKVVMFDRHHDALPPRSGNSFKEIQALRQGEIEPERLLHVTENLSPLDDDWLRAGMELGLLGDAVIFGTDQSLEQNPCVFDDHTGLPHQIVINNRLPGECFGHQGSLSDVSRAHQLRPLWDVLDWSPRDCAFLPSAPTVLFSIDLDAFVVEWEDYLIPWPQEVWTKRFGAESRHFLSRGQSGRRFVRDLLSRTGILTIAREPDCCGGEPKMMEIFRNLNVHVFDSQIGGIEPT